MKPTRIAQSTIPTLFLLSGVSALIYEVIWQMMLNPVFGNTTFASATIVASFMGGMAIGSYYFGKVADKCRNPLRFYSYLALSTGMFAFLFPYFVTWLSSVNVSIYRHFLPSIYVSGLIKFFLSFLVLLVPSVLMGGMLPLVSKIYVNTFGELAWGIGRLYGINSIGGVLGAISASFVLVPWIGVRETTYVAAALNIIVAAVAYAQSRVGTFEGTGDSGHRPESIEDSSGQIYSTSVLRTVLIVYVLSGFCALAYEILWTRVLVFFIGRSNHAFSVMLSTYLLALAVGSLIYARFFRKSKNPLHILAIVEVSIGILALLSLWSFSRMGNITEYIYTKLGSGWSALLIARYFGAFLLTFIPTLLIGVTFPLVNNIYTRNLDRMGRNIGKIYSINTLGCIMGSFTAGFVLIPALGITKSIMLIALVNVGLGTIIAAAAQFTEYKKRGILFAISAAMAIVVVVVAMSPGIILQRVNRDDKLLYYNEGASSTVAVIENNDGFRDLLVNGTYEVPTDYGALRTFHMLGSLPLLLHSDPQNVLILCFGAGIASGSVAQHDLQQIDAVELSPEVIAANKYFAVENQSVLSDPKVNLIVNDGRNYLLQTTKQYDAIISDATHPDSGDSWVLYTKDFYELCKARLNAGGIMAQWLPMHALAPMDYKTILKTFQTVFPETTLWFTNEHTILIGSTGELKIDIELLRGRLRDENVKKDLEPYFLDNPIALLGSFIMGKEAIVEYTQGVQINTDNYPFVQSSERRSRMNTISLNLRELSNSTESISPLLINTGAAGSRVVTDLEKYRNGLIHLLRAQAYYYEGSTQQQIDEYQKALDLNPGDKNIEYLRDFTSTVVNAYR